MKQVAVIGLGQFGTHLARELVRQRCEVLVLDKKEAQVSELRDEVHRALIGDAKSMETLRSIIDSSVDEAVVSMGENIEASVLCTLHLGHIGVKCIRAKAVNEDHASILRAVGATDVVFPERDTAERLARRIAHPALLDYFPFAEEHRIMEIVVPESILGQTLRGSKLRSYYGLIVLAIKSSKTGEYRFMPEADDVMKEGDILIVFGREVDLARFSALD